MVIDHKVKNYLEVITQKNYPPLYTTNPIYAREILESLQTEKYSCDVSVKQILLSDNISFNVYLTIIKPANATGLLPGIIYYHGGGWIMGSYNTHHNLISSLALGCNSVVVFVNYTLSPEANYQIILNQCYTSLNYMTLHGCDYNIDTNKLLVAGDSVGGNIATVMALMSNMHNGPKIKYQALFYPVTSAYMNTNSYSIYENGPWLTKRNMEWFWDAYAPNLSDRNSVFLSPINSTLDQLKNMPETLIITAENDVLRDEGEEYAHKLLEAGVNVTSVRYIGTIHDFMMLDGIRNTSETKSAIKLAINTINDFIKLN